MEERVKWIDLSRFHAALRVIPHSPAREAELLCLEVHDTNAFSASVSAGRLDLTVNSNRTAGSAEGVQSWKKQMAELGFSLIPERLITTGSDRAPAFRFYSSRATLSLAELQRIVPGVTEADYIEMPLSQVTLETPVTPEMAVEWQRFTETVVAKECIGVWVPDVNPFAKPYTEARPISQVQLDHIQVDRTPRLHEGWVPYSLIAQLENAGYRENALLACYLDVDAAVAGGVPRAQLRRMDLPHAVPLWVEPSGRIVAVRDMWCMPEVMQAPAQDYFGADAVNGLAVTRARHARSLQGMARTSASQWREWSDEGHVLDRVELERSVRQVVDASVAFCERFPDVVKYPSVRLLPAWRKPVDQWERPDFSYFAVWVGHIVGEAAVEGLRADLVAVGERARHQRNHQARQTAREALLQTTQTIQAATVSSEIKPHEDAGQKIGGARKDFHRRGMHVEEIEALSEFERRSLVIKKNVWPTLDYAAMREAGVAPQAAVGIKYLKDSLALEPKRNSGALNPDGNDTERESPEAEYVAAISAVRDLMAQVKTERQFAQACQALYDLGRTDYRGIQTSCITGGSALQRQWGSDACWLLCDSSDGQIPGKIRRKINRCVREGAEWDFLIKPKRTLTQGEAEDRTERLARERALHRPHLEQVVRTGGEDWRQGRDVTESDLLEHFGFRGIEFGNWLPQDERQEVLNRSFDALCDLADVLELPPRTLSFNGELALAFGARGRGGRGAGSAHFERGRNVVNLTRLNGAGGVAHEWFHGLDAHLGGGMTFLSEIGRPRFQNDPMITLMRVVRSRACTPDELFQRASENALRGRSNAVGWSCQLSPKTRDQIKAAMEEGFEGARRLMYEQAYTRLQRRREPTNGRTSSRIVLEDDGMLAVHDVCGVASQITAQLRLVTDSRARKSKAAEQVKLNVTWMVENLSTEVIVAAARDLSVSLNEGYLGGANAVDTLYLQHAKALDSERSEPYWSTPCELFARAGEQFVYYALADKGVRSDYLVHGVEEDRYLGNPLGNPYPQAADRQRFRDAFTALIDDCRTRLMPPVEVCGNEP
jgi:hypothetical protein